MKKIYFIFFMLFTFNFILSPALAQLTTPILTLNPDMHTDIINRISTDASGSLILTCSEDKTAKLWNAQSGSLIKTFHVPIAAGKEGVLYAGAISPDGKTVAVGGYTGWTWDESISVYVFDVATNTIKKRITGFSGIVSDLEYSNNGKYIVATMTSGGVGIIETDTWTIKKTFTDYGAGSENAAFDNSGRLATVCSDGKIRLYNAVFELVKEIVTSPGKKPVSLAFSPDGALLAVGFSDSYTQVYDGKTLNLLYKAIGGEALSVTFSKDAQSLISGGTYKELKDGKWWWYIMVFANKGEGNRTKYPAGLNLILDTKPMPDNSFVFSSNNPDFGRMKTDGTSLFYLPSASNSYKHLDGVNDLKTNNNSSVIGIKPVNKSALTFSVSDRSLTVSNYSAGTSFTTNYSGINISGWNATKLPKINSKTTNFLQAEEKCYSVDISKDGKKIVFGASNNIYCTDTSGTVLWSVPVESFAQNVNIADNGKVLVAGIADGIIRWYSMNPEPKFKIVNIVDGGAAQKAGLLVNDVIISIDGKTFKSNNEFSSYVKERKSYVYKIIRDNKELIVTLNKTEDKNGFSDNLFIDNLLMSLYLNPDNKRWVLWTPKGYFDCSKGAENLIGWHVNQGPDKEPLYYPASQFFEKFYVPNLGARILAGEEIKSSDVNIGSFKLPPRVKITSPINNSKTATNQLTVTVDVTDQGGGIDEILLYHNGKLIETTNRGFKPVEQKDTKSGKTFTITLTDGENKIKATAFNTERTEAIPDEITVNYAGIQAVKPNLYMLVIGINSYKNAKYNLNYALADASSFKEAIEAGSSTIFSKVNVVYIKDAEATKVRILEELNKIKAQAKQLDMFVFYYAGHGAMSEEDKSLFYIIPTDVTQMFSGAGLQEKAISAVELKQFSTEIKAEKQMFILDACQSGGMEEVLAARGAAEEKAIAQLARSTGTYWLAAANSQQFAGEFAQLSHGLFTYCILQALTGKADGQDDKKITVQELSSYLNDQVPLISKQYKGSEQYPVTYGFGQDFPIVIVK